MRVTPDGTKVVVGGPFTSTSTARRPTASAPSTRTTGALAAVGRQPVRPARRRDASAGHPQPRHRRHAVYGTGYVFGAGGNLEGTFSADPTTGDLNWMEDCHGDTYAILRRPAVRLHRSATPTTAAPSGGFPQTDPLDQPRARAGLRPPPRPAPSAQRQVGELRRTSTASRARADQLVPGPVAPAPYTGQYQAAWSVTGNSQYVVAGRRVPDRQRHAQQGLVRFAVPLDRARQGRRRSRPELPTTGMSAQRRTRPA